MNGEQWAECISSGNVPLSKNPEITAAVGKVARLVASMSIRMMQNTDKGDERVYNGLSRLVDIAPNDKMGRSAFYEYIVREMLLKGNVFVLPKTEGGLIMSLEIMPGAQALPDGFGGYYVEWRGEIYDPSEVLHFAYNPDTNEPWKGRGLQANLKGLAENLSQAAATERGFLKSKWKPSVVVKVDALVDEFSTPQGRKKLLDDYVASSEAGEPWMIPAEAFDVEQIRPLSLNDIALPETVTLNKTTVASVVDVPKFVLGVGEYKADEWRNFVSTQIHYIGNVVTEELTKKLLISPELYYEFNPRSLMNYNLSELVDMATTLYVRGMSPANEGRDWLGLPPLEGLDDLVILENYIPLDKIALQKKLKEDSNAD